MSDPSGEKAVGVVVVVAAAAVGAEAVPAGRCPYPQLSREASRRRPLRPLGHRRHWKRLHLACLQTAGSSRLGPASQAAAAVVVVATAPAPAAAAAGAVGPPPCPPPALAKGRLPVR